MAEKEYTVVAPDGKEITLIGPVGASHEEVIAQAQKLYKPSAQNFVPTSENRGNVINTDVPTVVGTRPNAVNAQPTKTVGDYAKAAVEIPATLASGIVATPVSGAYGIAKNLLSGKFGTQEGTDIANKSQQELMANMLYQPKSPVSQDIAESIGKTVEGLPPYIPMGGTALNATKQAMQFAPLPSFAASKNTLANVLRKEPIEPTGEIKPGIVQRYKEALSPEVSSVPSYEDLANQSSALFNKARESNVVFKPQQFAQKMTDVGAELRTQGYTPAAYPKITAVLSELQDVTRPKDFTELQALRKIIQGAQASTDPTERRLASILKTNFDEYISTAPESAIATGTKEGVQAWKEARDVYSRMSKSEVFDEMLNKAKLDKSKFTQSGEENSLAMQLRKLSENPKKMRLFSPAEQEAIKKAAEGDTVQNMLRFFGRFTPTGPVSGMFAGGAILAHPLVGGAFEAGALASRYAATQIRKNDVNKLAEMMRAGKQIQGE